MRSLWRQPAVRRWRYHAWGVVLIPLAPILVPLIGFRVAFFFWARALGWPTFRNEWRPRWFFVNVWWWYGYHGLYQIDWAMKRRARL